MGIVPLWGFQLAIAITLSFVFRLNKALVILAANISIPPMIPLILFLSHYVGRFWMGENAQKISFSSNISFQVVQDHFIQYAIGAMTLATSAALVVGGATYAVLIFVKRLKS
jgi:uncharacterized protein (DUF2062 family)